MNRGTGIVLCALLFALWQPAFSEEARANGASAPVDDEVRVTAKRQLEEIRKEIVVAEDRFLAKYNELNKEPEYQITCGNETPTGTRLYHRECKAKLVGDATEAEARAWLGAYTAPPASVVIMAKTQGFTKNMVEIVKKNPELGKLALAREAAVKRYDEARKRAFTRHEPNE